MNLVLLAEIGHLFLDKVGVSVARIFSEHT